MMNEKLAYSIFENDEKKTNVRIVMDFVNICKE